MYINEAKYIFNELTKEVTKLLSIDGVDKVVSTEFVQDKLKSLKYHIEEYNWKHTDEFELDENWIYEIRDEITADLTEAYTLIENYNTIEDYEPSEF
jgi:hypothetical protein